MREILGEGPTGEAAYKAALDQFTFDERVAARSGVLTWEYTCECVRGGPGAWQEWECWLKMKPTNKGQP